MRQILALLLLLLPVWAQAQPIETLQPVESQVLELANKSRLENGLPALTPESSLQKAARAHSDEMARLNYFDHESPTPGLRYPWDRVNLVGFDSATISENLYFAEGFPLEQVAKMAVNSWLHSADHRRNLLASDVTHMGIGVAVHGRQIYVTQIFSAAVEPFVPSP